MAVTILEIHQGDIIFAGQLNQSLPSPQPQPQLQSQPNPKQPEPIVISPSPGAEITLSSPSFGSALIQDEGFTHGAALPDDFKLWLSRHPGLTFDKARNRYREEQKQRSRVRLKH